MNIKSKLLVIATTLCLLMMGPLYATSPQKSTAILINGDDVGAPRVCDADVACELRNAEIDFIYMHDSKRVTVFDSAIIHDACAAGWVAGVNLTVLVHDVEHVCSR